MNQLALRAVCRLSAVAFAGFGILVVPPTTETCHAEVSKVWDPAINDFRLFTLCVGVCPAAEYTCQMHIEWGSGGSRTTQMCHCVDDNGDPHDVDPPCMVTWWTDPDNYGPGLPGIVLDDCPIEDCSPTSDPGVCEQLEGEGEIPTAPNQAKWCDCQPE